MLDSVDSVSLLGPDADTFRRRRPIELPLPDPGERINICVTAELLTTAGALLVGSPVRKQETLTRAVPRRAVRSIGMIVPYAPPAEGKLFEVTTSRVPM